MENKFEENKCRSGEMSWRSGGSGPNDCCNDSILENYFNGSGEKYRNGRYFSGGTH